MALPLLTTVMFFLCPRLNNFWCFVFKTLSDFLQLNLQPCPLTDIFEVPLVPSAYSRPQADVIALSSLLARRIIIFEWKSPKPPLSSSWLRDVMFFIKHEKIQYSLRGSFKSFPPGIIKVFMILIEEI